MQKFFGQKIPSVEYIKHTNIIHINPFESSLMQKWKVANNSEKRSLQPEDVS